MMTVAMIPLSFKDGTRTTTTVPLSDSESGATYLDSHGVVETLTMWWPDHPGIAEARSELLETLSWVDKERDREGDALSPAHAAKLARVRDAAMQSYAVALVSAWSFDEPCTPDAVRDLFARAPFAYELVLEAAGEAQRFLPVSLRTVASESAPSSEAPG